MKNPVLCSILVFLGCAGLEAQDAGALVTQAKNAYTRISGNLAKAAEKMPDENYSFKPTPEMRSYGALLGHIADAEMRLCGMATGHQAEAPAGSKTAKAEIVKALKASGDECSAAFEKLTDANYLEQVGSGRFAGPRLALLTNVIVHDNEEYGYLSVYLRLKGVVPPSSDRAGR